ncbi:sensor histidine kinase [Actinomadura roseirufa]|uniref:sensor histidine kinase n=1 Tax=Actinomadura roseirufa TaxID=2094049 RepID=UPI0010411A34|nr:HAMP domain-containing sensor histidine kinase [Actinomadura roseirufa]
MRERRARPRWARPSVRAKAALAAMAATVAVLALGGYWGRGAVRDQWNAEAKRTATRDALQVTSSMEVGGEPNAVAGSYVAILADGRLVQSGTAMGDEESWYGQTANRQEDSAFGRPWLGLKPAVGWTVRTIRVPDIGVRTFVVGTTDPLAPDKIRARFDLESRTPQRVTVYAVVSPERAATAVATLDRVLALGGPAAVLFVGLTAWLVTGRALRPVEAIRAELADITEGALDRRVPVPAAADVVAALARTTNETLDRLERAVLRQQRFVADASHELRSPLAALRGALEIPLTRPERADWPAAVSAALADTVRLQRLADDLLLLSSGDRAAPAGRGPERAVDLADLVEEQIAERAFTARTPAFGCDAERPALVRGEEVRVGRIVRNLLDNAARHARSSVRATVRAEPGPGAGTVVLTVTDDGPGVPAADAERIFDRFVRLDESRSRAEGGAGLGLPIARELAASLGGTVRLDGGSTFVVRLPATDQDDEPAAGPDALTDARPSG